MLKRISRTTWILIGVFGLVLINFGTLRRLYNRMWLTQEGLFDAGAFCQLIKAGDIEAVHNYLKMGMSPDSRDVNVPAVMVAIQSNNGRIAKLLLEKGANPNAVDGWGNTPLMAALGFGYSQMKPDPGIVADLLRRGAEVNAVNQQGHSALMIALNNVGNDPQKGELLRMVLQAGGKFPPNSQAFSALFYMKDPTLMADLIHAGADVNFKNYEGQTLLMFMKNPDILQVLVEAKADPNIQDKYGRSGWWYLCQSNQTETIHQLFQRGSTPDLNDRQTPICAERMKNAELLSYFPMRSPWEIYRKAMPAEKEPGPLDNFPDIDPS